MTGTRPDGDAAGYAVLWAAAAPSEYDFTIELDGRQIMLVPNETGRILIISEDEPVAYIEPAWATDANGLSVPTWYEVSGTTLVQHVDHTGDYAYPIIADPTIRWGYVSTVYWSKSETHDIASYGSLGLGIASATFCPRLGHWALELACYSGAAVIIGTAMKAEEKGQCVRFTVAGTPPAATWWPWYGRC